MDSLCYNKFKIVAKAERKLKMQVPIIEKTVKVFVSQPMRGKTNEEIMKERERVKDVVKRLYPLHIVKVEILDSFIKNSNSSLETFIRGLNKMYEADLVYFVKGFKEYRGCKLEFEIATEYNARMAVEQDNGDITIARQSDKTYLCFNGKTFSCYEGRRLL